MCGTLYRATGIVLMDLVQDTRIQYSLFEDPLRAEKIRELYEAVDAISGKYGNTLHLGASHPIESCRKRHTPSVREKMWRPVPLMPSLLPLPWSRRLPILPQRISRPHSLNRS
jgi:hypothetical protein